jgi:hypothetical protein
VTEVREPFHESVPGEVLRCLGAACHKVRVEGP